MAMVLAQFNPLIADQIYDTPEADIAEAYVSHIAYNYQPPPKK